MEAYSTAQAGLRIYSQTIAQEFSVSGKTRFLSFNLGIMDTEMQVIIQRQPQEHFAEVERFRGFKTEGKLFPPDRLATALLETVKRLTHFSKTEISIQELL